MGRMAGTTKADCDWSPRIDFVILTEAKDLLALLLSMTGEA